MLQKAAARLFNFALSLAVCLGGVARAAFADEPQKSGTTPSSNDKDYEDLAQQVAELEKQDAAFNEKKPLNAQKGELAIEDRRDYASLAIRIDNTIKESQLREQSVLDLWESLSERQSLLNSTPNIRPAKGFSRTAGARFHRSRHD